MNTKAVQSKTTNKAISGADIGKLIVAAAILATGVVGYSVLENSDSIPQPIRVIGVLATLVVAMVIAAFTAPGRRLREFLAESQFELRKVVWPTRDETLKTTGIIIVVVFVLSLILGLIDWLLKTIVFDWLLKIAS